MPDTVLHPLCVDPSPVVTAADAESVAGQVKQRRHFDWYAENTSQNYQEYQNDQTVRGGGR